MTAAGSAQQHGQQEPEPVCIRPIPHGPHDIGVGPVHCPGQDGRSQSVRHCSCACHRWFNGAGPMCCADRHAS